MVFMSSFDLKLYLELVQQHKVTRGKFSNCFMFLS